MVKFTKNSREGDSIVSVGKSFQSWMLSHCLKDKGFEQGFKALATDPKVGCFSFTGWDIAKCTFRWWILGVGTCLGLTE